MDILFTNATILPMTADLAGVARYRDADKSFTFPGGSRIVFGYCSSESDVLQYQGQEYDVIFMDEATQFTEFQFTTLTACLRGANDFPKRFYLTCNPGGVGHTWVKRLFIDKQYKASERPEDYLFIAANVYDNHALMEHDPDYVRMLENLPEEQRKYRKLSLIMQYSGRKSTLFSVRNIHINSLFIPLCARGAPGVRRGRGVRHAHRARDADGAHVPHSLRAWAEAPCATV